MDIKYMLACILCLWVPQKEIALGNKMPKYPPMGLVHYA